MIEILLADDDEDDCSVFEEALQELGLEVSLTTVCDGERLMQFLKVEADPLPKVLFLDLNIPRMNGMECLYEIKMNKKLEELAVIIYTTSSAQAMVNMLFEKGARYYIRKPVEFSQLKKVIYQALTLVTGDSLSAKTGVHLREDFVLEGV